MYSAEEKYLDTDTPYTSETIFIEDKTLTTTLRSNASFGMTDFTGQCKYETCTPP